MSRGPWKKNGALHSVIIVSDQAATSACSRTSLRTVPAAHLHAGADYRLNDRTLLPVETGKS